MIWVLNVLSALEKEYWIFHVMGCRSSFKNLQKDFIEHLLIIFNRFMDISNQKTITAKKESIVSYYFP